MFKHSKKALSSSFSSLFISTVHKRQTRSQTHNHLYVPKLSTNRCQKSIKFQGSKIWNSISPELKSLSFTKVKTIYKKQLIDIQFFSHALLYKLKIHSFVTKFVIKSSLYSLNTFSGVTSERCPSLRLCARAHTSRLQRWRVVDNVWEI